MSSAAERFYGASHERNVKEKISALSVREASAQLADRSHRYHCAFKFLESNGSEQKVVELGFGSPRLLAALSERCASYTIIDIVDRTGENVLPENVHFQKADLCDDFPFPDQSFDCVIAMMVIEHLFDPFHSFKEVARIVKPGGKVFINLPNIGSIRCRLELLAGRMPITSSRDWFEKREWDGNHLHYFTVADTVRLAKLSGLQLDALYPVGSQLWLKRLRPSLFCHEVSYEFTRQ